MWVKTFFSFAAFSALLVNSACLAEGPGPPEAQELRLKSGARVTIVWEDFSVHRVALYMKGRDAYVNGERLANLTPRVRQIVQWAAEDNSVTGDVELFLRQSLTLPLGQRIVAKTPFIFELPYATGINARTRQRVLLPVCCVVPEEQGLVWDANSKMQAYREYVYREQRKVQAAKAAADAAWAQAVMMEQFAAYALEILNQSCY
jgi:hypothetical protein